MNIDQNLLIVGMVSGKVKQFLLPLDWKFLKAQSYYVQEGQYKPHLRRVMGIHVDKNNHLIYTAGMDGTFKVYDRNKK